MKKSGFKRAFRWAVVYPLAMWFFINFISFAFGFTPYPDLAQQQLLSNTAPFILALAFGIWIGAESFNDFSFRMALVNTFVVSVVVGIVTVLLTVLLINNSDVFLAYAISVYARYTIISAPLVDLAISTCIGSIFTALSGAAAAYALLRVRNPRNRR
jgi:multisubunit Na+/H+ antiporter MnhB subunit